MKEIIKHPGAADVADAIHKLDAMSTHLARLSDTMANGSGWAAHWLGGDIDTGATEVHPEEVKEARRKIREARHLLESASTDLLLYSLHHD